MREISRIQLRWIWGIAPPIRVGFFTLPPVGGPRVRVRLLSRHSARDGCRQTDQAVLAPAARRFSLFGSRQTGQAFRWAAARRVFFVGCRQAGQASLAPATSPSLLAFAGLVMSFAGLPAAASLFWLSPDRSSVSRACRRASHFSGAQKSNPKMRPDGLSPAR